ncbi:hypothetical protein G6F35_019059 [Rhizopus arrhizus]|nr:hypothetical protein G6F35_019059 [Rhizopus arrhizus]
MPGSINASCRQRGHGPSPMWRRLPRRPPPPRLQREAPPCSANPAMQPAGAAMNSTPIGDWVRWAPITPTRAA